MPLDTLRECWRWLGEPITDAEAATAWQAEIALADKSLPEHDPSKVRARDCRRRLRETLALRGAG